MSDDTQPTDEQIERAAKAVGDYRGATYFRIYADKEVHTEPVVHAKTIMALAAAEAREAEKDATIARLREGLGSAIRRFETIQETHPDISLDVDLAYYREALNHD